jgi:hypothetical protein
MGCNKTAMGLPPVTLRIRCDIKYKELYDSHKELSVYKKTRGALYGPAVSALDVRSRKLSNVRKGQSSDG